MARKYLYADESGNFDFRDHTTNRGATRYFAVGTILFEEDEHRVALERALLHLRNEMIHDGLPLKNGVFHATEDQQVVRDAVFEVLARHQFKVDVTILEKAKAQPHIRQSEEGFYKYAWFYHMKYFGNRSFEPDDDLTVICSTLGTKKRQRLFREAVEDVVTQCCDFRVKRRVVALPCASDVCLQAADYALWAVMRDVEQGDDRSRRLIKKKIRSNFQLFGLGNRYYYGPNADTLHVA
jgi:hypothetical protein